MDIKRIVVKPYDKFRFEVAQDYDFDLGFINGKIEAGYKTDGASIPRIFWSLYPPYKSEYFTACVIHDWLCSKALHAESIKEAYKTADFALRKCMLELKVSKLTSYTFYYWCRGYHALKCLIKGYK